MDREQHNQQAWNAGAYQAWLQRFGSPNEAARKLMADPARRIGHAYAYMGEVRGKRIINLLGSNGNKAVALALLGAEVTVVDYSTDNEKYALELAREAGVSIRYIVSDVLKLQEDGLDGQFDLVFMEFGILHYFVDLAPLFQVVSRLLSKGGRLLLQDFHPVTTKLISSKGTTANIRKHKVTGDYFSAELEEKEIAYTKFLPGQTQEQLVQKVLLRNWTLGEIVTAVADGGLFLRLLAEHPNLSSESYDKGIPKSFTLLAEKMGLSLEDPGAAQ